MAKKKIQTWTVQELESAFPLSVNPTVSDGEVAKGEKLKI